VCNIFAFYIFLKHTNEYATNLHTFNQNVSVQASRSRDLNVWVSDVSRRSFGTSRFRHATSRLIMCLRIFHHRCPQNSRLNLQIFSNLRSAWCLNIIRVLVKALFKYSIYFICKCLLINLSHKASGLHVTLIQHS
jgi:hypothetical protein